MLQGTELLTGVVLAMKPTVVDFYGGSDVEGITISYNVCSYSLSDSALIGIHRNDWT